MADLGLSPSGIATLVVALALAGAVTGFLAGLFGIGGGGVLVPVLYETFTILGVDPAIRMHMALGTSLAIIVPTSVTSFRRHRAKGGVDGALLRRLLPWVVVGVFGGILAAKAFPSSTLKWVWVVSGTALALKMIFVRDTWQLGSEIPRNPLVEAYAVLIGFVSTLMSIGGAAYFVAMMTLYGRPLLSSISTSSGLGPTIAIPAVLGFVWAGWGVPNLPPVSLGFVSLLGAALVIPTSVFTTRFGVMTAHGLPKRQLELAFAGFLLLVAARFLLSLITG